MTYRIMLTKGLSYIGFGGKVKANKTNPIATVEDKAIADAAVASGYFKLVEEVDEAPLVTGNLDADQLQEMKLDDLKALAAQMGIDTKGMKAKKDYIEAITAQEVNASADGIIDEGEPDYTGEQ